MHKWQDDVAAATATAAAAAAKDKEVSYTSKPLTGKDTVMAAISPEVGRCHVCCCSCMLKGVDWPHDGQSGGSMTAREVNRGSKVSRKGLT